MGQDLPTKSGLQRGVGFMVMPFGKRATGGSERAPAEVDFDELWRRAFEPALRACGYMPVRGDQEWGPLILQGILERLTLSSLVLADLSVENGNVYYEIGVRHAVPGRHHCALIAADWATPKFDLSGVRQARYPLPKGELGDKDYAAIRDVLERDIPHLAQGEALIEKLVPGYPKPDATRTESFREWVQQVQHFQEELRVVRALRGAERDAAARQMFERWIAEARAGQQLEASLALEALALIRDHVGWGETLQWIETLAPALRDAVYVREQSALASAKLGQVQRAIVQLEALIHGHGGTPERYGLLGGRYKEVHTRATEAPAKRAGLRKAIEAYEAGMHLDLNESYCASNLPRLYRQRNSEGDEARAQFAAHVTIAACERARRMQRTDEWLLPTLLGAAFDVGDVARALELVAELEEQGPAARRLDTTLADAEVALENHRGLDVVAQLQPVVARLRALAGRSSAGRSS
jgi:hypothetical protein